jgi:hypothetical protein
MWTRKKTFGQTTIFCVLQIYVDYGSCWLILHSHTMLKISLGGTVCYGCLTPVSNIMLYRVHLATAGFELTLVVIDTDCIGSYKSNYLTITTMTPHLISFKITRKVGPMGVRYREVSLYNIYNFVIINQSVYLHFLH